MPAPKKGVAYTFTIGLVAQASRPAFKANPTLAAGDFKLSKDGGAFANLTALPTVAPASGRAVEIALDATEMNADRLIVQCVDAAGAEWDECLIFIETTAVTVDDLVRSTTPANTLDVSAGGNAGIDWGNVVNASTTVGLSGTTIKTATDVETDTADIQARLPAALGANGNIKADVRDYNGTAGTFSAGRPEVNTTHAAGTAWGSGAITAASIAADAITAAKIADGAIDAATFAAGAINAAAIAADAITDAKVASDVTIASVTGAVGSVTGNVGGNVTGSVGSVATGGITAASIADGAIDRATFAADTGLQSFRSNTAQAGGATSITLDASASSTTDFFVGAWIVLTGGTGVGQARVCTAYNGTTKAATVAPAWATNPDNTTTFAVMPAAHVVGVQGNVTGSVASVAGAVGSVTGNVGGNVTGSVGSIATGGIAAASFAAGAIDAAAIATDAIDAAALAADAITEIQSGLSTLTAAGVRAAVGLASANLDTQLAAIDDYIDTEVAAIKAVTDALPNGGALTQIQADLDDIQTRLPAALTAGGNIKADVLAISGDTVAADNLETAADGGAFNLGGGAVVASSVTGAVGSVTGNVGGNVTGSVGSVVGNVGGNVTGSVGSVVGAVGSVTGNVGGNVTGSVGSVATGGIAAASFAAGAITSTVLAADCIGASQLATDCIGANELAASAITEIQAGLSTLDAAGIRSAVGLASANLDTQLSTIDDFLDTEVAAIKAKTDQLTFTSANKVDATIQAAGDFAQGAADKVWGTTARTLTAFSHSVTVGTNNDKTGYSLTQSFPSNFASLAITAGGAVTAGTVSDKTGYSLSSSGLDAIVIETGLNARQALCVIASASGGKLTGADSTNILIYAAGSPSTLRIDATVDSSGNRSAVTLTVPA